MVEFPPNLDDGELWIPSDIFPSDDVTPSCDDDQLSYLAELLAQRVAAYALLRNNPTRSYPMPPRNSFLNFQHLFGTGLPYGPTSELSGGYFGLNVDLGVVNGFGDYGTGGAWDVATPVYEYRYPFPVQPQVISVKRSEPVYECRYYIPVQPQVKSVKKTEPVYGFQYPVPVQPQVERFMEPRARVLQRQQSWSFQNRISPCEESGVWDGGCGGCGRQYGGTGVFLPQPAPTATTTNTTKSSSSSSNDARKKWDAKSRENQVFQEMNSLRWVDTSVEQEGYLHFRPELCLPRD